MARKITVGEPAPVFKGTDAVVAGGLTRSQLRGPAVRRLFQGVYALASERAGDTRAALLSRSPRTTT